ncbi:hypothetical protein A3207_02335 [Candidatus Methanomassiliicoccus intestinalis]|nr:tetratricopeptide repeat protein [Candidatus Methanomassiliicoccus intestinalis]TQS82152.1 MAG: hypothetical protein A3206_00310 [Candidatus Methanomassiliicoccus intestinalis]TQS84882.1 MAG: hypothetical protein A3207_02335 [Candidatus Methanomassiliicoccus intestinalis]
MMDIVTECRNPDPDVKDAFDKAIKLKEENPSESEKILRVCISKGCTDSMVALGNILSTGTDEQKKESFKLFTEAGNAGNIHGLRNSGYALALGIGCSKNKTAAAEWYKRAAEAGHAKAQCNLGVLYSYGNGVSQNDEEAAKWYKMSAENGYSRGQTNYGEYLMYGRGVKKDAAEAAKWFEASGSNRALFHLAELYLAGDGVPQSRDKAIEFLKSSSDGGYAKAMTFLASLIINEDRVYAESLYTKAAEKGNQTAIDALRNLGLPIPCVKKVRN